MNYRISVIRSQRILRIKTILRNVNLKINDEFTVITGPNGGGKSTMAKIITGIVKPTSGKILLDGEDITELSITERAKRGISFAFQQPVRFKGLTVLDLLNLAHGEKLSLDAACQYMSEVGLCRQGLYQPRGECVSVGRRAEADRDCDGACTEYEGFYF